MNLSAIAKLLRELANELDAGSPTVLPAPVPAPVPVPLADRFAACLPFVLKAEGGFVNNPQDPGGATNQGITLATFRHYTDLNASVDDLKAVTPETVARIYRTGYWAAVKGDQLQAGVDLMLFDMAVNSGPAQSVKLLQRACMITEDGFLGPATLAASQAVPLAAVYAEQEAFYRSLHNFPTFGAGWLKRLDARYNAALAMV